MDRVANGSPCLLDTWCSHMVTVRDQTLLSEGALHVCLKMENVLVLNSVVA